MKRTSIVAIVFLIVSIVVTGCSVAEEPKKPESLVDRASYSLGLNIGKGFEAQGLDIQPELFLEGLKDGLGGVAPLLTEEEMQETMETLRADLEKKQRARLDEIGSQNQKKSEEFFAGNKDKEGAVTLPSGLQYKVEKEGSGKSPALEDSVTVHYSGKLLNGQEFDSSYKRGQPATFKVNGVVPGWTEALQLMKEGSKWRLFIPPDLAYGPRGAGSVIPPNAALIFDVELIKVN